MVLKSPFSYKKAENENLFAFSVYSGLEEGVRDEEATWDLVDRVLSRGLHVARAKSLNLFRLFYPESRDSQEPTGVYKRSGFFEENE